MLSCIMADMEKKVTYIKDAHLHIRVDRDDLERWKESAKKCAVDLTTYVINMLNGRPKRKTA